MVVLWDMYHLNSFSCSEEVKDGVAYIQLGINIGWGCENLYWPMKPTTISRYVECVTIEVRI